MTCIYRVFCHSVRRSHNCWSRMCDTITTIDKLRNRIMLSETHRNNVAESIAKLSYAAQQQHTRRDINLSTDTHLRLPKTQTRRAASARPSNFHPQLIPFETCVCMCAAHLRAESQSVVVVVVLSAQNTSHGTRMPSVYGMLIQLNQLNTLCTAQHHSIRATHGRLYNMSMMRSQTTRGWKKEARKQCNTHRGDEPQDKRRRRCLAKMSDSGRRCMMMMSCCRG